MSSTSKQPKQTKLTKIWNISNKNDNKNNKHTLTDMERLQQIISDMKNNRNLHDNINIQSSNEYKSIVKNTESNDEYMNRIIDYSHGPTWGDHSENRGHWNGYWENRNKKVIKQSKEYDAGIYGELSSNGIHFGKKKRENVNVKMNAGVSMKGNDDMIFKDCVVYINGKTNNLSAFHLQKIIVSNGGNISCYINKNVTHIICGNLNLSKSKDAIKRMNSINMKKYYFVNSNWITDSIKFGKKMNEYNYITVNSNNKTIDSFFQKK